MSAQKKTGTRGPKKPAPRSAPKSGKVAVVGRPNVGKSTFLNAALDTPLAIVSPTPQTTRDVLLGVRKHEDAEILLLDTPGFHKPSDALGRAMNRSARGAALDADVIVFITDLPPHPRGTLGIHPGDKVLLEDIGKELPTILVVNKVDRLKDKAALLPLLQSLSALREFVAVIPISARRSDGVLRVLDEVVRHLPEGEHRFGQDDLTDRPMRYFAAEYVREQILLKAYEEVPHAACVTIDSFDTKKTIVRIAATIHVEKEGQKAILIGKKGEKLKAIGEKARLRIEELLGAKVFLEMYVKVSPAWRMSGAMLSELGLTESRTTGSGNELGGEEDREVSL